MRPADLKLIQQILSKAHHLERTVKDHEFPPSALDELKTDLRATEASKDDSIRRFAEIAKHLKPEMTLRHFINQMLPCERFLKRSPQDDDFLVRRTDFAVRTEPLKPVIFILENLRSSFNVGSIFRLADGVGVTEIFVCGYTPRPDETAAMKTALGSENSVCWRPFDRTHEAVHSAQQMGYKVVALETAGKATNLYASPLPEKIAWLVGNERFGLENDLLGNCDEVRFIPQFGMKNSLNVAVALGIAAFEWQRQTSHPTVSLPATESEHRA